MAGKDNVLFDPFTLVSHATDATDWRLHLPIAVVMPDDERQVAPLLAAIARLGLKAIPRGAGTGLTGGAVPLRPGCVVVNTEKLNRIRGLSEKKFRLSDGREVAAKIVELEAGVITERAMEHAAERGLVFATDPTSAWACTIGGNIAENAGGKDCVLWGTCIDNLVSWRIAMPSGRPWTVRRVGPPPPQDPPGRPGHVRRGRRGRCAREADRARRRDIRKKGLWKDITNKALGGVPGLQKEGTDGVITSAEFVLYPEYEAKRTLCLEFFGPDFDEASRVILQLSRAFPFPNGGKEALSALEHFDDEYVRAIDYKVKAPRAGDAEGGPARGRRRPLARARPRTGRKIRGDPRRAPEHAPVRGARRRRGEALLGGPQEARRHRAADERVQDERGRRPPARGAGRVRAVPRGEEHRGGAVRAGAVHRPGGGDPAARAAAQGRSGVARPRDPGGARPLASARAALSGTDPKALRVARGDRGAPARLSGSSSAATPGSSPRSTGRTARCATGSSCSRRTCTPATATCT